jgi:hypothetical protein
MLPSSGQERKALTFLQIMAQTTWYPNAEDNNMNLQPHSLHCSPYIVRDVKLRNMRRTGYVV